MLSFFSIENEHDQLLNELYSYMQTADDVAIQVRLRVLVYNC